ncbi:MAG: hypothetical protein ABSH48_04930 [Verrucomicrobiota bacterium]|jgi:hypothetical protein
MNIEGPIYGIVKMVVKDLPGGELEITLTESDGTTWQNAVRFHRGDGSPITLRSMAWSLERQRRHISKWKAWKIVG